MVQYDVRHKFDGIGARCAAVRVEVQGSAAAFVENGNIWMATDVFSRHMSAENERQAAAEALEASQKIATGSLVEGEDEGECPELETVLATPPADICGGGSRGGKFFTHFAPPPCSCERSSARHAARAASTLISRCEFSSETRLRCPL